VSDDSQSYGNRYATLIDGQTFFICTEREYEEDSDKLSNRWRAWSFFAYDRSINIYPVDSVPTGIRAQQSIAGDEGESEDAARKAVEARLRKVIRTRKLDGTGFYSPSADRVYPQEFPEEEQNL
jgi:hypothetical protein